MKMYNLNIKELMINYFLMMIFVILAAFIHWAIMFLAIPLIVRGLMGMRMKGRFEE